MPGGLLDSFQIQFSRETTPSSKHKTQPIRRTYATAPQRRVRPRPSPRTQRIAGASAEALRLSSQESLQYDQWLVSQYANTNTSASVSPSTKSSLRHMPYDPANTVPLRATLTVAMEAATTRTSSTKMCVDQHQQQQHEGEDEDEEHIQPWDNEPTAEIEFHGTRSSTPDYHRSDDPDRFGHEHQKKYNEKHAASFRKGKVQALVPNSKAKKEVLAIISKSVVDRKRECNDYVLERKRLMRIRDELNQHFTDKLDIRFRGLQFEALEFEQALGMQIVVDQRLHAYFHGLLCKYLFDLDDDEGATSLVDEIDSSFYALSVTEPIPQELATLFHNEESTVDRVLYAAKRELIEARIRWEIKYKSLMMFMLKRVQEEVRLKKERMSKLTLLVDAASEQVVHLRTGLIQAKKGAKQISLEERQEFKKLKNMKKLHTSMLEKSQRQVEDDERWQIELERAQQKTKRIAQVAAAKSRTSAMKVASISQAKKKTLINLEQMYQEQRMGPYKKAAQKIFDATGVDSVEKILETFQDQAKKELIMRELTEEKEQEKVDSSMLLQRLRKVLSRGMVAGMDQPRSHPDGNIEGVEASLDHSKKILHDTTEKLVQREQLANSAKAGISSLCFKLGIKEDKDMHKTLNKLEKSLVNMLETSYKTVGEQQYGGITIGTGDDVLNIIESARRTAVRLRKSSKAQVTSSSPLSLSKEMNHNNESSDYDHHPYETELRKKMLQMDSDSMLLRLSSPCDSPNNIRISPTKKPLAVSMTMRGGKLVVEKVRQTYDFENDHQLLRGDPTENGDSDADEGGAGEEGGKGEDIAALPNLLGVPAELEKSLRDTIGEYSSAKGGPLSRSQSNRQQSLSPVRDDGEGEKKSTSTSGREGGGRRRKESSSISPPPPPPRQPNDVSDARRIVKWSTTTIVDSYRKKFKKLQKAAQLAQQEGRFEEANFVESIPLLKTRQNAHQMTLAMLKREKEEASEEENHHSKHSHHHHHHHHHHHKLKKKSKTHHPHLKMAHPLDHEKD